MYAKRFGDLLFMYARVFWSVARVFYVILDVLSSLYCVEGNCLVFMGDSYCI